MSLLRNKCTLLPLLSNTSSPLKTGLLGLCYFVTSTFKIYIRRIINNNIYILAEAAYQRNKGHDRPESPVL